MFQRIFWPKLCGKYDKYIPFNQAQKLQTLTPEPKTIINLKTSHLSPTNQQQLKQINKICNKWFEEKIKKDQEIK